MNKIRVMIVGYGNVGRGVIKSLRKNDDFELVGLVSRSPERVKAEFSAVPVVKAGDPAAWTILRPDVAILCGGSKDDLPKQGPEYIRFVNTVDSFDNHSRIPEYFHTMDAAAKRAGRCSIISTGWDPGIFSLERVLGGTFLPGSRSYGFYGLGPQGGLSMGHSDALRTIPGVLDARQFTHAVPAAIERVRRGENPDFRPGDMHTRECFIVADPKADKKAIEEAVRTMPGYFAPYQTTIHFVSREELAARCPGTPHDGLVVTAGTTGADDEHKALAEYRCVWGSNPEATANVLVAHARACVRLAREGRTGAFTILDVPPAYFSRLDREELLKHWM